MRLKTTKWTVPILLILSFLLVSTAAFPGTPKEKPEEAMVP
jgi:hypothetical protein